MSTTFILNTVGKPPEVFDFPIDASSKSLNRNELTTLIELPYDTYRESHGEGHAKLTMEGSFGTKIRTINGKEESGFETFYKLESFIERYWKLLKSKDSRISNGTTLEYHNWNQEHHYRIADLDFSSPQSERNKTYLIYNISGTLYDKIEQPKITDPPKDVLKVVSEASFSLKRKAEALSGLGKRLSSLTDGVRTKLKKALSEVDLLVSAIGDFQKGVTDLVLFPLKGLKSLGQTINGVLSGLGTITTAPITELANTLRSAKRVINRLAQTPEAFKQTLETATSSLANAYDEPITSSDSDKVREDKENGSGRNGNRAARSLIEQSFSGVESYSVSKGDTLQSIAAKKYGDASKWKQIAIVNGIDSSSDLDGLDKILIPVESIGTNSGIDGSAIGTGDTLQSTQDRLYGTDLKLSPSNGKYGFSFNRSSPYPDIIKVKGLENLSQAVFKKVMVSQGTLLEDPLYGRSRSLGGSVADSGAARMKWSIERSVLGDSRIEAVKVDIISQDNRMDATVIFEPIGSSNQVGRAIAEGI